MQRQDFRINVTGLDADNDLLLEFKTTEPTDLKLTEMVMLELMATQAQTLT